MIRTFLPTDLLVILFQNGLLADAAKTKDGIGKKRRRSLSLAALSLRWLTPRERRRTWVWTEGISFRGLASGRNRSLSSAWEVDHLMLNEQDANCCSSLLERLSIAGGELGVEKIFLRLPAESPLLTAADEAGFSPYVAERLYSREKQPGEAVGHRPSAVPFPRRKRVGDDYRLFELYEKCVPAAVRRVEGMTFSEWQATRERGMGTEWLFENGDNLVGWLGIKSSRRVGQFAILANSEDELAMIMEYGLLFLGNCRRLFCLVPEFEWKLFTLLQEQGFKEIARYATLAKEPIGREKRPCLVPASA